jgi:LPXTG-site transpeptidase (sortase) family protein
MSQSRTGVLGAAAALAIAGVVMLVVGFVALGRDPGMVESAAPPSTEPPTTTTTPAELLNPVRGPEDPQFDVVAPAATLDLVPTRVRIPSIAVDAGVVELKLKDDQTLEVPEDVTVTGWYTGRSVPGEVGPSIVVGHVDSAVAGAGVFFNLRQLQPGDAVEIERSDGSVAQFEVSELVLVDKDDFPTDRVYGSTDRPTLRLITCGGSFDRSVRSYVGNVIVYAEHVGNRAAPLPRS